MDSKPLLEIDHLSKWFEAPRTLMQRVRRAKVERVYAVNHVSLEVRDKEILGLVGESGCGKTTLGRTVVGLYPPSEGSIRFQGQDVARLQGAAVRQFRRRAQMIFQDPYSSLNARMTVRQTLREAIEFHKLGQGRAADERVDELLARVGLTPADAERYPKSFSGGQRQRIGIARTLAVRPDFIVADEPVSALDVSIQASILNLIRELQQDFGLSMIFVAHDLGVVRYIADRVAVMYLGRVVEIGTNRQIFAMPSHPYTRALLSAIPKLDPAERSQAAALEGEPPSPFERHRGCPFASRCREVQPICHETHPAAKEMETGHWVNCHMR